MYILQFFWVPLILAQFLLVLFFGFYNKASIDPVLYLGWAVWAVSMILGWMPILIFKRKGGVPKGKAFVHTTVLVDSGLYSIVRHPQYTSGILFSLSLILISQSWLILAIGAIVIPLLYFDIVMADKHEVGKFGNEYKLYMNKVPRTNFILGIIRLLIRRKGKRKRFEGKH